MSDHYREAFFNQLKNQDRILFGPYIGELGWEITRWSGFVRWFKKKNPNVYICSSTRKGREDLYHNSADEIHTFTIDGDYIKYRSNMYRLDFWPIEEHNKLLRGIRDRYPDLTIIQPPNISKRDLFHRNKMDFNITPREENSIVIEDIISKNNRVPICISPRHRIDSPKPTRNWPIDYWNYLYEKLIENDNYLVFILGSGESMVKPPTNENFIIVEDIKADNTSKIGLTIEAIKHSELTVGQQSALPVLSNLLSCTTIMWGNEKKRHQVIENPMNTRCVFFEELSVHYRTKPELIFNTILKECHGRNN